MQSTAVHACHAGKLAAEEGALFFEGCSASAVFNSSSLPPKSRNKESLFYWKGFKVADSFSTWRFMVEAGIKESLLIEYRREWAHVTVTQTHFYL